jgi:hypothetical protein
LLASKLDDRYHKSRASKALQKIGPLAEAPLIKVALSDNSERSWVAIRILANIGTSKSDNALTELSKNASSKNANAARSALEDIRMRERRPGAKRKANAP